MDSTKWMNVGVLCVFCTGCSSISSSTWWTWQPKDLFSEKLLIDLRKQQQQQQSFNNLDMIMIMIQQQQNVVKELKLKILENYIFVASKLVLIINEYCCC